MKPLITSELLQELAGCRGGVKYFRAEHGRSAPLKEVLDNPRLPLTYAAWLGQNLPAEFMTWEARLALQFDDWNRAQLGWHCPAGVEGATWESRLALQSNVWERAELGRYCPAGVDGATLESRLDVQIYDHNRAFIITTFGGES